MNLIYPFFFFWFVWFFPYIFICVTGAQTIYTMLTLFTLEVLQNINFITSVQIHTNFVDCYIFGFVTSISHTVPIWCVLGENIICNYGGKIKKAESKWV